MMRTLTAACALVFAVQASSAADLYDTTSRPLNAAEISAIYADHTWHWEAGAGYFGSEGDFKAWSTDASGTPGSGTGRWTADDGGRLCFDATWQYDAESTEVSECFGHRLANGAIYQRAEPAGEWYVFRSEPPQPDDEINRFTAGDDVTARIQDIRSQ